MNLQPCKYRLQKHIPEFSDYSVDNYGVVTNLKTGKDLAYSITHGGYYSVRVCKHTVYGTGDKVHQRFLLSRLVLRSFRGMNPGKPVADHIDNNPANNSLVNLRWSTQSANVQRAYDQGRAKSPKAGTGKFGKLHHRSNGVIGYDAKGNEVVRFESIGLAKAAGYILDFYRRKYKGCDFTVCKGITFKKA